MKNKYWKSSGDTRRFYFVRGRMKDWKLSIYRYKKGYELTLYDKRGLVQFRSRFHLKASAAVREIKLQVKLSRSSSLRKVHERMTGRSIRGVGKQIGANSWGDYGEK